MVLFCIGTSLEVGVVSEILTCEVDEAVDEGADMVVGEGAGDGV